MSLRRVTLGIGSGLFDKLVVACVQLALVPVLANVWGVPLYGIWAVLMTAPTFLVLTDFGIIPSAWARMTHYISRGEIQSAKAVLHTAWCVVGVVTVVLMSLGSFLLYLAPDSILPVAPGLTNDQARLTILLLVAYGLGIISFNLLTIIFRASGNFPASMWCNTSCIVGENAAFIASVFYGANLPEAALVLLCARLVANVTVFLLATRKYPVLRSGFDQASRYEWGLMWRPALSASLMGFGTIAFLQLSVLSLGVAGGAAAVPAFVAVRTLSRIALQLCQMVSQPISQEFAESMAVSNHFQAGRYFAIVLMTSAIMGTAMAAGLAVLGTTVVRLWTGGALVASFALLGWMALSSAASVMWSTIVNLVSAVNRQGAVAPFNFVVSMLGLAFILWTGERMGAVSAGIAFALVDWVTMIVLLRFAKREWLSNPEFLRGFRDTLKFARSPVSLVRLMRHGLES